VIFIREQTIFHGTPDETIALMAAVDRFCDCTYSEEGDYRNTTCSAHRMMVEDQRALNGLLWWRRFWAQHLPEAGLRRISSS